MHLKFDHAFYKWNSEYELFKIWGEVVGLNRILFLSLFLMGFAPASISLPILAPIFLCLFFFRGWRFNIYTAIYILFTLILLFLVYVVFWYNIHEDGAMPIFFYMSFTYLFFVVSILMLRDQKDLKNCLVSFSVGIYCSVLMTCIYTIFWKEKYIGIGSVFNPLFGPEPTLSPVWSNMLALALIIVIFLVDNVKLKLIFVFLGLAMGVYLGGRTFFLVVGLALLLTQSPLNLIYWLAGTVLVAALSLYIGSEYIDQLILVFEAKGLDSTRFLHWQYALDNFQYYPFGGMEVNQQIEGIGSFHNIFIDIYRIGGVPLFVVFLVHLMIAFAASSKSFRNCVMLLLILIILMQDSIFEGGVRLFFFYLFFSAVIIFPGSVRRPKYGLSSPPKFDGK